MIVLTAVKFNYTCKLCKHKLRFCLGQPTAFWRPSRGISFIHFMWLYQIQSLVCHRFFFSIVLGWIIIYLDWPILCQETQKHWNLDRCSFTSPYKNWEDTFFKKIYMKITKEKYKTNPYVSLFCCLFCLNSSL